MRARSGDAADAESDISAEPEHVNEHETPGGPPEAHAPGQADPVEMALADALQRAALAGAWDAVAMLTAELRARREARANVVKLDAERARRDGKR